MKLSKVQNILNFAYEDISNCKLGNAVTQEQLKKLEKTLKRKFNQSLGIDFRFPPHHVLDRSNDKRNADTINICHIREILRSAFNIYKEEFQLMAETNYDKLSAVLKSVSTDINMPFEITWTKKGTKKEFVPLTIMQKKNFFAKNGESILPVK
jgi:RNAse (barnase) inhibitor barstar